jgi:hypothetical protein
MSGILYEALFLRGLLFTESVEIIIFLALYYFWLKKKDAQSLLYGLFVCILATALTLPYVWFIFPVFIKDHLVYVISAEAFAYVTESLIYLVLLKSRFFQAIIISTLCNTGSFILGILFFKNIF